PVQEADWRSVPAAPIGFTEVKPAARVATPWPEIAASRTEALDAPPEESPAPVRRAAVPPSVPAVPAVSVERLGPGQTRAVDKVAAGKPTTDEQAASVWVSPWPTLPEPLPP